MGIPPNSDPKAIGIVSVLKVMLLDNNEPTSYGEAMVGPYSDKWLEAMKSEINGSLRRRRTWTVMLPFMKLDLWLRVFPQVQGVDYDEIFLIRSDA